MALGGVLVARARIHGLLIFDLLGARSVASRIGILIVSSVVFFGSAPVKAGMAPARAGVAPNNEACVIADRLVVDLDGDGRPEEISAVRERLLRHHTSHDNASLGEGGILVTPGAQSRTGDTSINHRAGFRTREYAPFRLRAADIDADGETELLVGVRDRNAAGRITPRLHIFSFTRGRLVPFWFCGRSYEDFDVAPLGGRIRLLELQRRRSVFRINVFSWQGFGWWLDATLLLGSRAVRLDRSGDRVVLVRSDGRRLEVGWNEETRKPTLVPR